jgi:hypothetical protein
MTEDTQAMSIRLARDLHDWLRRESFETRKAMNALITEALTEYRAKHDPDHEGERDR